MSQKNRPDFSRFLAHFTKDRNLCVEDENNPLYSHREQTAFEKLLSILQTKTIKASTMPWTNTNAVCFTECPWASLVAHTNAYSAYGVGFKKKFIYQKKGGPVLYLRADLYQRYRNGEVAIAPEILPFITLFNPSYSRIPENILTKADYSHEREWRTPSNLSFEYTDVEFVIVKSNSDIENIPNDIVVNIGKDKILVMDNYLTIEKLWPTHKL